MNRREVRTRILEIARRRQKPGSGSSQAFLRQRTALRAWPDLAPVLQEIPWAVVGGVATRHYAPERATADLDILLERGRALMAHERLHQAGFRHSGALAASRSLWYAPDGTPIDVLTLDTSWMKDALALAAQNRDLQALPILPLPYLALTKLQAGRPLDIGDLTRMLGLASDAALDELRAVVSQFDPEAREDVETMILLGRMEIQAE